MPLRHLLPTEAAGIDPVKLFALKHIEDWSHKEVEMLVEFIVLMGDGEYWPRHKRMYYWQCSGEFVRHNTVTAHTRSGAWLMYFLHYYHALGNACQFKVV